MPKGLDKSDLSRQLQALRKKRGLKVEELAALTYGEVSASSLQKYEAGQRTPGATALGALANALGCSQDDINPYVTDNEGFYELPPGYPAARQAAREALYKERNKRAPGPCLCNIGTRCPAKAGLAPCLYAVLASDITPAQLDDLEAVARRILGEQIGTTAE
jgi:transcriptional regulator with XRE-family HTH domain